MTTTVRLRRYSWMPDGPTIEATLDPHDSDRWQVTVDGVVVGHVERYEGSLDRDAGHLRIPGKRRTLWAAKLPPYKSRWSWDYVSRAEAIRYLVALASDGDPQRRL